MWIGLLRDTKISISAGAGKVVLNGVTLLYTEFEHLCDLAGGDVNYLLSQLQLIAKPICKKLP
jgi:hypothetical protein